MQPATTLDARSIVEETGKAFRLVSDIDAAYEGSFGTHGLEPTSG